MKTIRLFFVAFCLILTLRASQAQEVQIDLDKLSKIAYCASVFKEQQSFLPLPEYVATILSKKLNSTRLSVRHSMR